MTEPQVRGTDIVSRSPSTPRNKAAERLRAWMESDNEPPAARELLDAALAEEHRLVVAQITPTLMERAEEAAGYAFIEGVTYGDAADAVRRAILNENESSRG